MISDILLKAAEDVSSGVWCKYFWFADPDRPVHDYLATNAHYMLDANEVVDDLEHNQGRDLLRKQDWNRCAEGSIAIATAQLGGGPDEFGQAVRAAEAVMPKHWGEDLGRECQALWEHNDHCLPDDPFVAGQELAKLFREAALG